jgi:Phospholipase_D-nuclease N-terminal
MLHLFAIFDGMGGQEMIIFLIILLALAFHLAMLFDLLVRKKASAIYKIIWFLVICIPLVGAIVYYFYGNSKRNRR